MKVLKRFPILSLTLANAVALTILAFAPPAVVAVPVDGCDETKSVGCGCLEATVWYPAGCYEHAGTRQDCVDDGGC